MSRCKIVIDLLFGDGGKGLVTNYLCSHNDDPIVVRFSGGQQAGHTVIRNGIKHISSNFGSGVLNNVPTYFSEHCTVYPNTISRERFVLSEKGIQHPILVVHPLTKITTPSDVAYNRIMERKLNHGSCGLGIGTTMKRHITTGYKLHAVDTMFPPIFLNKVKKISDYYKSILLPEDIDEFLKIESIETKLFEEVYSSCFDISDYFYIKKFKTIIFEGSQGVLLDMDHGMFPNVTYSNTTSKNAIEICEKIGINSIELFYVTRCYQTRHGEGWMSNEDKISLINNEEEINKTNKWQGNFRTGEIDYDLLNHALRIDNIYSKTNINLSDIYNVRNANLVVTCLDQRPGFKFDYSKITKRFFDIYESYSPVSDDLILTNISVNVLAEA